MELSVWLIKRGILGGLSKDSQVYCGNMHRKIFYVIYTDCKPLKTTTNYDFMYYYVYVLLSQLFMYLFTILCMYIYILSAHGAYIHSFSVIFHHLSVHVNIRSAHCPCTYSLAVYIYNT